MHLLAAVLFTLLLALAGQGPARAQEAVPPGLEGVEPVHALTHYGGPPRYPPGFDHFDYADPQAPKGGAITLGAGGTFDSLNPFILAGTPAGGLGLTYDTLAVGSDDEVFTYYGSLAEAIWVPEDRSWVAFRLREEARWHDGEPVRADDVVWTFETLLEHGRPFYRAYYADVTGVEALDDRTVKFTFAGPGNSELPLIMGQLTVLPRHYWEGRDFTSGTLEPPPGSGPYRVATVEAGRSITFERVADWWGADLGINRGRYNFDRITFEYYRDVGVMLEAFLAGRYDIRSEHSAGNWATGYETPAVRDGRIVREEIPHNDPQGMQAFVFNTRRPVFSYARVREAINYLFDFEWTRANLFYGQYERTESYFSNSELASSGLPSDAELALLEPYRGQVPERVFSQEFDPPETDGSGRIRRHLREALRLFAEAGWRLEDGQLVNEETGDPMRFELLYRQADLIRIIQPFVGNLERAGITAEPRLVDSAQFVRRLDSYDFDMTIATFQQSLSPGNEQRDYWGSERADVPGGRNLPGVRDPVVDAMIDAVIGADSRDALVAATRALDRVLLWDFYVVPHYHNDRVRLAYWNRFGHPETTPPYGLGNAPVGWVIGTWWQVSETAQPGGGPGAGLAVGAEEPAP
ncbi:MAG: ABC transporter substrate-binding protein [Gammaproteobacteria bacterium]|jgi:microcin C transport system substrate-binding protein|nr:ABC transporter substrate-binding protein [Gammaproteobacteria bacterium]